MGVREQESERPSNGQVYPEPNNLGHRAGSYLLTYFHGSGPVICKYFLPICGFFSYSLDAMDFVFNVKLENSKSRSFFFCYLFVDFVLSYFSELISLREDALYREVAQVETLEELPRRKHLG